MPLHMPHFGSDKQKSAEHSRRLSSSASQTSDRPTPSTSSTSSIPHSILRHAEPPSRSGSHSPLDSRLAGLSINREDTMSSAHGSDTDSRWNSTTPATTPGTSVSSFGECPLPPSSALSRFPFFLVSLSSTSTLQFIALPLSIRPAVLETLHKAWPRGMGKMNEVEYAPELMKKHADKGCDSGVWQILLKGDCWVPRSEDRVASKRIIINLMTEFAKEGYKLQASFRTSAKDSGKDTLTFIQDVVDPDPEFFCVAFYSTDRIWIIDADAEIGEAIEKGISEWWLDGVKDARVRERHCREIRLKGTPWTSHNPSSLISARCIHLVIMNIITRHTGGYEFVGSIDMSDKEEAQMPATFYRRRQR